MDTDKGMDEIGVRAIAPVLSADISAIFLKLVDRIPTLAELETVAAIAWKGYQKHGRGVVLYVPVSGALHFAPFSEYVTSVRRAFEEMGSIELTMPTYDPFSELLFAAMIHHPGGMQELALFKVKMPKPLYQCRATWLPIPHTEST
jgi:hypothetical protein